MYFLGGELSLKNTEIREKSVTQSFQFLYIENNIYSEKTWTTQEK